MYVLCVVYECVHLERVFKLLCVHMWRTDEDLLGALLY